MSFGHERLVHPKGMNSFVIPPESLKYVYFSRGFEVLVVYRLWTMKISSISNRAINNSIDSNDQLNNNDLQEPNNHVCVTKSVKTIPNWKNIFFIFYTIVFIVLVVIIIVELFRASSYPCNAKISVRIFMVGTLGLLFSAYQTAVFLQYDTRRLAMASFPYVHMFPFICISGHLTTSFRGSDSNCFYSTWKIIQWIIYFYSPFAAASHITFRH